MTVLRLFAASLAMLGVMLAATSQASAAAPGVVPDLTWYTSDAEKQRTVAAMEDIGSKWVRLNVQWSEAEPVDDVYNEWWLNEYEKAIDMARAAGQQVIIMVDTAPVWASGAQTRNVPQNPADYAEFMGFLANRFKGKVAAYEVWNEPNLKRFWSTGPDPREYAAMLKSTYPRIKAADPAAKVVFGGVSGNDYGYIEQAYAAGVKGSFDVMATHPYTYCGSTGPASIRRESDGRISRDSFLGYREVRATMAAHGDAKPIWFTEFGWNTSSTECNPGAGVWQGGVSEANQAKFLYDSYKLMEQDPYVQVALWYDFRNNYWMKDADTPEARYGLLRTDFSQKPAYAAYKAYAHGAAYPSGSGSTGGTTTGGTSTGGTSTGGTTTIAPVSTQTKLNVRVKSSTRAGKVAGRVRSANGGTVLLEVERRSGSNWRKADTFKLRLNQRNAFARRVHGLPKGVVRMRATYRGTQGHKSSRSRFVRLRLA